MHWPVLSCVSNSTEKSWGIDPDPDPDPDPDNPGAGNGPDFVRSQSPDMPSPHVRYALAHGVRWSLPGQGLSGLRSDHSRLL